MDGKAWEKRIKSLLRLRHGYGQLVDVPDEHGGDFGLECFSRDGIAYQCYAPLPYSKAKDTYEHQRTKMTADIGKFIDNKTDLVKLLGPVRIRGWHLVVPRHCSAALVQHATLKATAVKKAALSYVDKKFYVHVETEDDFELESAQLLAAGLEKLTLPDGMVPGAEPVLPPSQTFVQSLERKIEKILPRAPDAHRIAMRDFYVKKYIDGQNLLTTLRASFPEFWESAIECKETIESDLELVSIAPLTSSPRETIEMQVKKLETELLLQIPALATRDLHRLSNEAVADWLLRCPLNFP